MSDAWQILRASGLPLAIESGRQPNDTGELAAAVLRAIRDEPEDRAAEALAAFIFAWSQHWPRSFADALGVAGDTVLGWAASHVLDENRYVKLRRIAIENLSHVL